MRQAEIECRLLAAPDGINLLFALSQFGHIKSPLFGTVGAQAHGQSAIRRSAARATRPWRARGSSRTRRSRKRFHGAQERRNLAPFCNRVGRVAPVLEGVLIALRSARRLSPVHPKPTAIWANTGGSCPLGSSAINERRACWPSSSQ